jgi:putative transposase
VPHAAGWRWSSAPAHLLGSDAADLLAWAEWRECWSARTWNEALDAGIEDAALLERIRRATIAGRPIGGDDFVRDAEARLGRRLAPAKRGPKPKSVVLSC